MVERGGIGIANFHFFFSVERLDPVLWMFAFGGDNRLLYMYLLDLHAIGYSVYRETRVAHPPFIESI